MLLPTRSNNKLPSHNKTTSETSLTSPFSPTMTTTTTTTTPSTSLSSPTSIITADHQPPDATSPVLEFNSLANGIRRSWSTGITYSEARGELYKLFFSGALLKRGFRHRKKWNARWIVLCGRNLFYADGPINAHVKQFIGSCELMGNAVIEIPPINTEYSTRPDQQFDFNVYPCGKGSSITAKSTTTLSIIEPSPNSSFLCFAPFRPGPALGDVWQFRARNSEEREKWIVAIKRAITLIQRTEMTPTLTGVGPVTDHFIIDTSKIIGVHAYGNIYSCIARATGREFRVRVIPKAIVIGPEINKLKNELRALKLVMKNPPPYVVRTIQSYETSEMVHLISEKISGPTLEQLMIMNHNKPMSVENVRRFIFQISSALTEIHSRNIIVCGIRPSNIVFEHDSTFKLADFAKAMQLPSSHEFVTFHSSTTTNPTSSTNSTTNNTHSIITSLIPLDVFSAPEVLLHHQFSRACDIWSLGCVALYIALGGRVPDRVLVDKIDSAMVGGEEKLAQVMRSMLRYERSRRIDATGLIHHEWISQARLDLVALRTSQRKRAFKTLRTVAILMVFISKLRSLWIIRKNKQRASGGMGNELSSSSPGSLLAVAPTIPGSMLPIHHVIISNHRQEPISPQRILISSNNSSPPSSALKGGGVVVGATTITSSDIATSCSMTSGLSEAGNHSNTTNTTTTTTSSNHKNRSSGSVNTMQQQQQPLSPLEARNLLFAPDANAAFSRSVNGTMSAYPPSLLQQQNNDGTTTTTTTTTSDRFSTLGKSLSNVGSGIGISSSVAGQLSEIGSVDSKTATGVDAPVKPLGPFLAALEHQLHEDLSEDENDDDDDEEEDADEDGDDEGGGGGDGDGDNDDGDTFEDEGYGGGVQQQQQQQQQLIRVQQQQQRSATLSGESSESSSALPVM
jgi:serine/threonine protein kinase